MKDEIEEIYMELLQRHINNVNNVAGRIRKLLGKLERGVTFNKYGKPTLNYRNLKLELTEWLLLLIDSA